jgi:hypothetical protein
MADFNEGQYRAHALAQQMHDALRNIDRYELEPAYFRNMKLEDLYDFPGVSALSKMSDIPPGARIKPSPEAFKRQPGYRIAYQQYVDLINDAGGPNAPSVLKARELIKNINRPSFLQRAFNFVQYGTPSTDAEMVDRYLSKTPAMPAPGVPAISTRRLDLYENPTEELVAESTSQDDVGQEEALPTRREVPEEVRAQFPEDVQALSLDEARVALYELRREHDVAQAGFDQEVQFANQEWIDERRFWAAKLREATPPAFPARTKSFTDEELWAPGAVLEVIVTPLSEYDRARYYIARNEAFHKFERQQIDARREQEHNAFMERQDNLVEWIDAVEEYRGEFDETVLDLTGPEFTEESNLEPRLDAAPAETPASRLSFSQVLSTVSGAFVSFASRAASAVSGFAKWVSSFGRAGRGVVELNEELIDMLDEGESINLLPPAGDVLPEGVVTTPGPAQVLPSSSQTELAPWSRPHAHDDAPHVFGSGPSRTTDEDGVAALHVQREQLLTQIGASASGAGEEAQVL